jgi:carbamoyltransferase
MAMSTWLGGKLFHRRLLRAELSRFAPELRYEHPIEFAEHHLSHAASAFYPSPFTEAAVLTLDGVGEWATAAVGAGHGDGVELWRELDFPHSLGLLYSAFTSYLGFKVNSGEQKVMGLAPYGRPTYAQEILDRLIDVKADGSFRIEQSYFDYATGLRMTNSRFDELFGGPPRAANEALTTRHMDVAASIQAVTEEVVLRLTRALAEETGHRDLCLAGGVALNCVANGRVLRDGRFKRIWVQPAAGDAGGSVGAALLSYYDNASADRTVVPRDGMQGSYLGPAYSNAEIESTLTAVGARFSRLPADEVIETTARALADGQSVAWFQGRMEFGPRSLGNRSILADPRSPTMQRTLNLQIKFRESFRPFAPSVLRESAAEWFDLNTESPYMLLTAGVKDERRRSLTPSEEALTGIDELQAVRSVIPAVTHVDYSARVQTVDRETNPRYHELITRFEQLTGCPILVNTSFNVRGEPIVCSPDDAFRCFMGTELDALVIGDLLLRKDDQDEALRSDYRTAFAPD